MVPLAQPIPGLPGFVWASSPIDTPIDTGFLTSDEHKLYQTFSSIDRQRQWLAGRRAARSVLRAVGAGATSILRNTDGAPHLEGPNAHRVDVAITHGRTHAAAIATHRASEGPYVGIDWVDPSDVRRIRRLRHRVLTVHEQRLCGDEDVPLRLAWGAREAIAKATQTGMFRFALSQVHLVAINHQTQEVAINLPNTRVRFILTPDHSLVVAAAIDQDTRNYAHQVAFPPTKATD